ncbi:hypothetical protein V8E53_012238 [Lactarius tabidus]
MCHDELVRYPQRSTSSLTTSLEETEEQCASDREVSWRICDRWLFNTDDKPSVGHNRTDEKDRMLVDKFHPNICSRGCLSTRKTTINGLPPTPRSTHRHLTVVFWGFCPYRTGIAPAFRCDAIIVGPRPLVPQTPSQAAAMQQHQQQMARQGAIRMPQTMGAPISIAAAMKKLPSALNVPQMRVVQRQPPSPSTNGQTSPTPAPPSVNESEEPLSSSTPTQQLESATPSTEATAGSLSTSSPMPIKPTQSHHALPLPNGYHLQNNYAAAMTNRITTYLHPCTQKNGLTVLQLWLKNAFTNGQQEWSSQSTAHASLGLLRSTKAKGQGVVSNDIVK